jgi:YVTN family beta-propeller protein
MNLNVSRLGTIVTFAVAGILGVAQALAQNAYITNFGSNTVSVINTRTNIATATIPVGSQPFGVAVSPDGSKARVCGA